MAATGSFRWRQLAVDAGAPGEGRLFADEPVLERRRGVGEYRGLEFLHVHARRLINEVPPGTPFGFRWTVNAYRGCSHACTYCFARPTHEYLGLDMGADFDSRIVVKVNAVERLQAELARPQWAGEPIAMGTNTDPYQRAEGRYRLTRGLIEVLNRVGNPFSVLTKSTLILRDLPLLAAAAQRDLVRASLSVGTLDAEVSRLTEPGAPHPRRRFEAVAQLNAAGVPCAVLMGPVLPCLSDAPEQLAEVVDAAAAAGAVSVSAVYLHLRGPLRDHVLGWAERERPEVAARWRRLYAGRANVPKARQAELSGAVAELLAAARRRHGEPARRAEWTFRTPPPARPAASASAGEQLALPLG